MMCKDAFTASFTTSEGSCFRGEIRGDDERSRFDDGTAAPGITKHFGEVPKMEESETPI